MKAAAFIVFALFIDGVQAALSASLAVVAAFPGTIAGGAAGCLAGNYLLGDWGCTILGIAGSLFGTLLDGAAIVTEPVGIMIGFAISFCISATFGAALVALLIFNGFYYPKWMLPTGIAELIPGFDLIPTWTAMVILCIWQKKREESAAAGSAVTTTAAIASPSAVSVVQATRSLDGIKAPGVQTNAA